MEQWTGGVCVGGMSGTAGVDGKTIDDIARDTNSEKEWLEAVREELRTKCYRPSPVRRVQIPKAGGGECSLGIPMVKDRVVQMAVYLVLMPIYEADFHPRSFGFRPERSVHQAVEEIREALRMGKTEVVDADLAKYFDTILPRSSAGAAIAYTLSLWKKLCLFAHDGRIEIDDNLMENAIRPTAVGKNYPQLSVMRSCLAA